jgi:hypothetical protein
MKIEAWKDYWKHNGHEYGMCYADHLNKKFYINIPKNASTWGKQCVEALAFEHTNYIDSRLIDKGYEAIIFLRDPIDRWYTGIAEYIHRYGLLPSNRFNKDSIGLILHKVVFDEHTEQQRMFLQGVNLDNAVFFKVDHNLSKNFRHYCKHDLNTNVELDLTPQWVSIGLKKQILDALQEYMTRHLVTYFSDEVPKSSIERLNEYYKLDTVLYNSVQYYIKGE